MEKKQQVKPALRLPAGRYAQILIMRPYIIVILIICSYTDGISQRPHKYLNNSIKVDSNNVPLIPTTFYFPSELMPTVEMEFKEESKSTFRVVPKIVKNEVDSFHLIWYSRFLFAMKEPLLFNRQFNRTIFRFTWLRTFHHPIVVRIEKELNNIVLFWKVTDGEGGYDPGSLIINERIEVGVSEWTKFISLVDSENFWEMQRSGSFGTDGSEWILEGVEPTKYYVTSAWSPGKKSEIFQICYFLIELTKIRLNEEEIY